MFKLIINLISLILLTVCSPVFAQNSGLKEIVKSQQAYAKKVMKYLFMNQPNYRLAYEQTFGDPVKVKI